MAPKWFDQGSVTSTQVSLTGVVNESTQVSPASVVLRYVLQIRLVLLFYLLVVVL